MGRAPCCEKQGLKKGPWTPEEDEILVDYIKKNGHGSWRSLPKLAGLLRCGKSCRLRWTNYLRPDIKRGPFTPDEEKTIIQLHAIVGNRWSTIASQLPGRTDNEIKNFWNTHLKKRLVRMGLDPAAHASSPTAAASSSQSPTTRHMAQWESARLEAEARLSRESLLFISSQPEPLVSVPGKSDTDHFLRIWNSEVGDSFRRFRGRDLANSCNSPVSPASSSTAMAAATATASTITSDRCGSDEVETGVLVKSELSSSNEGEESEDDDSQDTSLNLLLDLPADEMGFFQGQISNFPFTSD